MEDRVLAEYLKSGRQLHEKYEEIKTGRQKRYIDREEKYKPILSPMQSYSSHLDSQTEILKEINNKMFSPTSEGKVGDLALEYLLNPPGQVDNLYGIYRDNDGIYIFLEDDKVKYTGTHGLWELLTMEYPNPSLYDEEDLKNYANLVLKSHTYRPGNKPMARRIKTSEGYKYKNIILPILYTHGIKQTTPIKKKGEGLQKIVTNTSPEYVYYNSIDELLERLYILYGELKAGNSNVTIKNEIVEIISEFKKL